MTYEIGVGSAHPIQLSSIITMGDLSRIRHVLRHRIRRRSSMLRLAPAHNHERAVINLGIKPKQQGLNALKTGRERGLVIPIVLCRGGVARVVGDGTGRRLAAW
jgi:hypothetical protein